MDSGREDEPDAEESFLARLGREDESDAEESFLARLGITDRRSGIEGARGSRQRLLDAGRHVLESVQGDYTTQHLVFSGFLARAQGIHEGTVAAIEQDNPYAALSLLRAYSENAAAILYLSDHPRLLDRFWRGPTVRIGKITKYAVKRFASFKPIDDQLSDYAHPASRSMLNSFKITNATSEFQWRSAPAFRSERELMIACGWVVELAEATSQLLVDFGDSWAWPRASAHGPDDPPAR
jgi:hypothetical protein